MLFTYDLVMQTMKNQNQAEARVIANQARHAFAQKTNKQKKPTKSLDHSLLLMLFISWKRNKK